MNIAWMWIVTRQERFPFNQNFQILDLPQVVLTKGGGFFRKSTQAVEIGTSVLLRKFEKNKDLCWEKL